MSILQNTTALQNEQTELQSLLESVNALPEAGSGGASGVEYEIITIPAGTTSATYTLPRVTAAYGSITNNLYVETPDSEDCFFVFSIYNNLIRYISYVSYAPFLLGVKIETNSTVLNYTNGIITGFSGLTISEPIKLVLINDPNADAIST